MRKKTIVALFCILAFFQSNVSVVAEEEQFELERIQEAGVLHVGLNESYPPFVIEQSVARGEYTFKGLSISVIEHVAEELGVEVEYHFELFLGDLLAGMDEGEIDVMVGGITDIGWAELDYPLSEPYYGSRHAIIVHEENVHFFDSIDSMRGQTIGVTQEAHNENMEQHFPEITLEQYEGLNEIVELVYNRELAGVVVNEAPALLYSELNEGLTYFFIPELGTADIRISFAKEDEAFLQTVNEILASIPEETMDEYWEEAVNEIQYVVRGNWYMFDEQAKEAWIEARDRRLDEADNQMGFQIGEREDEVAYVNQQPDEEVTGFARVTTFIQENPRVAIGFFFVLIMSWIYVVQRTKNE